MARYEIRKGSQTGHCCFEWTVVDTTKPEMRGPKENREPLVIDGVQHYEPVCECYAEEDARAITAALNEFASQTQG